MWWKVSRNALDVSNLEERRLTEVVHLQTSQSHPKIVWQLLECIGGCSLDLREVVLRQWRIPEDEDHGLHRLGLAQGYLSSNFALVHAEKR